ncbi:helix-turn-helix transcriptional regulator [Paenibacillus tarimensis]|uniref:helix-turn-helix transcriptional regulator n=1 Tax=Paenibacillus tarimensis TaxID=416012 RepID=UPI001F231C3F|nr:AraC family transcriptional regulator [Paenibacillus tarimensis]MCF2943065.1 AraC family transcriptional regulator [Paenibacillus tarimensis]
MEAYNEKVDFENPLLSLRIFRSIREDDLFISWHYHREIELLLIDQGELDVYIEDEYHHLTPGDIVVIGSSQLHRDKSTSGPLDYYVLQFDIDQFFDHSTMQYIRFFTETKNPLSRINYIFKERPHVKEKIAGFIREIFEEAAAKPPGYEMAVSILIKNILLLLLRNDPERALEEGEDFDRIRLKPVFDYVEANLTSRIHVDHVCKLANMSYYYFVKFFKKAVGLSFTEYVNYRKIKWAERILLTEDRSISEIGEKIGIPNMAHFYKMFKKYNDCSPKEYQKKMLAWNRK